jgi:hypothetical protein
MFNICNQKEWDVSRMLRGGGDINLTFRRNFDTLDWIEWGELENELSGIELTNEEDSVRWALTSHGQFTMYSLHMHWLFPGVRYLKIEELWHSMLPLKVKNFVWLVLRNRVQTTDNLGRKKWTGSKFCQLC